MLAAAPAHIVAPATPAPRRSHADEPANDQASQSRPQDDDDDEGTVQPSSAIVVTGKRLDATRTQIAAGLGSTVYSLTNDAIENRPGGETGSLSAILTQAPGVTLAGTSLYIRGSPANEVRINNVIVPEAIADPADQLSSRLAATTRVLTGTLPAQFGFTPAGVISVTTKNGLYQHGGQAEFFAGTDGMIEPAIEWSGSAGRTSLFGSGDLERGRSVVADATLPTADDRRRAIEGLAFGDHVIDGSDRLSMIIGGSDERHVFVTDPTDAGNATSGDGFAVGTFQHSDAGFTVQASLFGAAASDDVQFRQYSRERRSSFGTQVDATSRFGAANMVRFGLLASRSKVDQVDPAGNRYSASRTSVAVYGQDEWAISPSVTLNSGARVEWLRGFGSAAEIEPRASLVWTPGDGLTAHIGYARYASAPPPDPDASRIPDERDSYLDAGLQQRLGSLTLGIDGYWRFARDYIAERRDPESAVAAAFAFDRARIRGVDLSLAYASGRATAWANVSVEDAKARSIIGGEALFPTATIAASARWLPLASERPVTASGGFTWRLDKLSLGADALVSSGAVGTADPAAPNGWRHSPYALVGLSAVYHAAIAGRPADLRLDLTNLTDVRSATSDYSALEGGWTRWNAGRAVIIGIEQGF